MLCSVATDADSAEWGQVFRQCTLPKTEFRILVPMAGISSVERIVLRLCDWGLGEGRTFIDFGLSLEL